MAYLAACGNDRRTLTNPLPHPRVQSWNTRITLEYKLIPELLTIVLFQVKLPFAVGENLIANTQRSLHVVNTMKQPLHSEVIPVILSHLLTSFLHLCSVVKIHLLSM